MSSKTPSVYQFKITLNGTNPRIWRRIVVPEAFTFWDLHGAIQDSMGWEDLQLHQFRIHGRRFGAANEFEDFEVQSDKTVKIGDFFDCIGRKATYEYDFRYGWEHEVVLEKVIQEAEGWGEHPRCIAGKRACPPENCEGLEAFDELLTTLADAKLEGHKNMKEWIEKVHPQGYKPDEFDPKSVEFNHFVFGESIY